LASPHLLVERSATGRRWHLAEADDRAVIELAQRLDIPEIAARLLTLRGVGLDDAAAFLDPRLRDCLPDPSHLLGLDTAVDRLAAAVERQEPVGLIGDYDADGATSAAMLARYLDGVGCPVHVEIPDRIEDGYGPNRQALARLQAAGCAVVLTLDSGTTAFECLDDAAADGLDLIVVDHHQAEERLPKVLAVINPNRRDQTSELGHLAAVGVTFMLIVGLNRALKSRRRAAPDPRQWLDLVAVGTVCDVVPLQGLNRALVRQGLKVAARTANPGLQALCAVAKLGGIEDARQLGFALGPRLNAGGRLGNSQLACRLLRTEHPGEAATIAQMLDQLNAQRQTLERQYTSEARTVAERQIEEGRTALTLAQEGWHQGVVGIVASRIVDLLHRPTFVIAWHDGVGKGSGRSVAGIDLGAIVIGARREGIVEAGGGHSMAAGLTLRREKLADWEAYLASAIAALPEDGSGEAPPIEVEGLLSPSGITLDLLDRLEQLAPFGAANPEPRFALSGARISRPRTVGRGHLSCLLTGEAGGFVKAIAFRAEDKGLAPHLSLDGAPVQLTGRIRRDRFGGQERPQFEIEDVASAGAMATLKPP